MATIATVIAKLDAALAEAHAVAPIVPPPGSAPTWRAALTQKDVWGIALNTPFSSFASEAVAQINIWNGAAAHGGKVWFGLGGAHGSGGLVNSMWVLDLNQNTPTWTKLHPGSSAANYRPDYPYYADGLPGTRHTYYSPQFISGVGTAHNRVMYFGCGGYGGEAVPDSDANLFLIDGFDLVTNTWDAKRTWASVAFISGNDLSWGSPTAIDPRTEDIWIYASGYTGNIWKWTKAANTLTNYGPSNGMSPSWWYNASLIDATRNRMVVWQANDAGGVIRVGYFDLTTRVGATGIVTGLPQYEAVPRPGYMWLCTYAQLVHDTINDRYLFACQWVDSTQSDRQSVFSINPTTWAATLLCELPYPLVVNGSNRANGIFGRFAWHPDLKGVSWTAHSDSPTYFMPVVNG